MNHLSGTGKNPLRAVLSQIHCGLSELPSVCGLPDCFLFKYFCSKHKKSPLPLYIPFLSIGQEAIIGNWGSAPVFFRLLLWFPKETTLNLLLKPFDDMQTQQLCTLKFKRIELLLILYI